MQEVDWLLRGGSTSSNSGLGSPRGGAGSSAVGGSGSGGVASVNNTTIDYLSSSWTSEEVQRFCSAVKR